MTIEELKRALVEVKEICGTNKCSYCPLNVKDTANVPYCPLIENEDGIRFDYPYEWEIDCWKEDAE